MAIRSLRSHVRADNLTNQVRAGQSLARHLYLGILLVGTAWIAMQFIGPMIVMDADGQVVQNREVVMPSYPAQVISVAVAPGDVVKRGQRIATVVSTQMLDLISDLTTRQAEARSRQAQIKAKLDAIDGILQAADKRLAEATEANRQVEKASAGGFSTATRRAEVAQERYAAMREAANLRAEAVGFRSEQAALADNLSRITGSLEKAVDTYRDGALVAPADGTVGPKVVVAGMVLGPGDPLAEIYHGEKYVIGYLTTRRLYAVRPGDEIVIMDGVHREAGVVDRVEAITDRVPAEFQSSFRSIDRYQVVRVAMKDSNVFPLLAKIKVTKTYAPSNLLAEARAYIANAVTWTFSSTIAAAMSLRGQNANPYTMGKGP
jgi:multidrug resistance efflux pump